ncbi:MAG: glycosyltransferase family 2 protein [Candidatus Omnitrophica bacterium]|nr:glycosyltransferase family 2 protein [Candidatus Omnitrophota bacterium]
MPNIPPTADLTAIILTHNESKNLPRCLETVLGWTARVIVVDSLSADDTVSIARAHGAEMVRHVFSNHPDQWNWCFHSLSIHTPWMILLDADHRVTPALRDKLLLELPSASPEIEGYYVQRHLIFQGQRLKWGGCTRPMLKVARTGKVWCDVRDIPDMRFYVAGKTALLEAALLEDNLNEYDIRFWIGKQRAYAKVIALAEWRRKTNPPKDAIPVSSETPDQKILRQKENWYRMPRYGRAVLYFIYRYLFLGGFLDSRKGLIFHAIQGFWLRWMADVELGRLQRAGDKPP